MTITQLPAREKRLSEMARRPWKPNAERPAGDGVDCETDSVKEEI